MEHSNSSKRPQVLASAAIAVWVVLLALIQHFLLEQLQVHGGWTFTAVIMFFAFMQTSTHPVRDTLCGAVFGLLSGAAILWCAPFFVPLAGVKWCSSVPVSIVIVLIIVGHNFCPMILNNTAFGYMILSTMQGRDILLSQLPSHLLLLIVGGLVAIFVTVWVQGQVLARCMASMRQKADMS